MTFLSWQAYLSVACACWMVFPCCVGIAKGADPQSDIKKVRAKADPDRPFLLGKEPVTVVLPLEDEAWQTVHAVLNNKSKQSVVFRFEGFNPSQRACAGGINFFLNLQGDPRTLDSHLLSSSSPYFIGHWRFYPLGKTQGFYTDAASTRRVLKWLSDQGQLDRKAGLRITLLGTPRRDEEPGHACEGIPFSEVALIARGQEVR